uniref:Small integral membrane protein 14 n=1 Tax=Glossina brevipalpis TaxID=37001 RepID=A0A1A9X4X9_9MUSC
MGDEFDGCECVWSHEYAMQRLLAFIRQNQNDCTDHYCLDVTENLQQPNSLRIPSIVGDEDGNNYTIIMLIIFFLVLCLIRPQSLMSFNKAGKRRGPDADGNGGGSLPPSQPPPAPPAVN